MCVLVETTRSSAGSATRLYGTISALSGDGGAVLAQRTGLPPRSSSTSPAGSAPPVFYWNVVSVWPFGSRSYECACEYGPTSPNACSRRGACGLRTSKRKLRPEPKALASLTEAGRGRTASVKLIRCKGLSSSLAPGNVREIRDSTPQLGTNSTKASGLRRRVSPGVGHLGRRKWDITPPRTTPSCLGSNTQAGKVRSPAMRSGTVSGSEARAMNAYILRVRTVSKSVQVSRVPGV